GASGFNACGSLSHSHHQLCVVRNDDMRPSRFGLSLFLLSGLTFSVVSRVEAQDRGIADFPKLSVERDWPWWRGPSRNGIAASTATPPTKWSNTQNVVWKTPVRGRGHSS